MHDISDIEICSVGMDWQAGTGVMSITFENIADAIAAANDDPHICTPRGKLGHFSALNDGIPMWDPFEMIGDAAPAFGTFTNLRATNEGATLVGDAINVPDWITAGTYPNRSMESVGNVKTPGGKTYSMVVTGVGWLGEHLPAVQDLEDLVALIDGGPKSMTTKAAANRTHEGDSVTGVPGAASISTSLIRSEFHNWCDDENNGADANTYWWWARDIRVDPDEIIADDDEGGLFRIPFKTDGTSAVTFQTPVKVIEQFTDHPVSAAKAATAPVRVLASFTRPTKRMDDKQVAASADDPDTKESNMDPKVHELLTAQGIDPDKATEEQITAATAEAEAAPEADPTATDDKPEPVVDDEPEPPSTDPIAAAEAKRYAKLEADNAALTARLDKRDSDETAARRDSRIAAHVGTGRLSPADRDEYRALMDLDEDRVEGILASRAITVPVGERGEVVDRDGGDAFSAGDDGLLPANVSLLTAAERARMAKA